MEIVMIAAVAQNGAIGKDGEIPWSYPEDMKHFKETTVCSPVIMGRRTYEDITEKLNGPLDARHNIVLTTQPNEIERYTDQWDGDTLVSVARNIDEAASLADDGSSHTAYVIGGESVYESFYSRADRLLITQIPQSVDGDTYFPKGRVEQWCTSHVKYRGDLRIFEYKRA